MTERIPTPAENGEHGKQIAEQSPDAAGLLVQIMDQNAREAERMAASVQQWAEQERDEWRERALRAEARLDRIEARLWDLLA